ncbi:hypothetical protein LT493_34005 [Streptomyces tricolor]|nr:hypothetical protein [Streptomyces tricolor]
MRACHGPWAERAEPLALQVRAVPGGTVRSHRLFPAADFTIAVARPPSSPYVETSPREIVVRHQPEDGRAHRAQLTVRLDLYELLDRLHRGHQPGVEDRQGQNLALAVFKNAPGRNLLPGGAAQRTRITALPAQPPARRRLAPRPRAAGRGGARRHRSGQGGSHLMAQRRRDTEFKHLGVSYLDFKRVQMDRVLTGFLMRLNHKGPHQPHGPAQRPVGDRVRGRVHRRPPR